ncbi:MAG: alpha/beta hydrolase [Clostridia bacterium]|nr:alpha/beta hydrolase [Clostridia bacterium]
MNPIIHIVREAQTRANAPRIAANPNPYGVHIMRDIPYLGDGRAEHLLDVYAPVQGRAPLPVIVEMHGGGYISCNKEINAQHGQYLASRGFRVVNMNYTLCPEGDIGVILNELVDVLEWTDAHKVEYGFDTSRVCLTGDSAGGHFVLLAAAMFTTGRSADFFHVRKPPFPVAGYAASCPEGSFDWRLLPPNLSARMLYFILHKYTFDKAYVRHSSYEYYMTGGYPRVWFCTSPTDSLLYTHTQQMHEYMTGKGIPHEYREYASPERKLDHVFNVLHPEYPESIQANEDMIRFFKM